MEKPNRHPLMPKQMSSNPEASDGYSSLSGQTDAMLDTKQQIRKRHILERNALSAEAVLLYSNHICQNLQEYFRQKENLDKMGVYGYYPLRKEASLLNLYEWLLEEHVPLAFPRVSGETMEFYQVDSMQDFCEGAFHIMEPVKRCKKAEFTHACCLTPGSVFDLQGNRYGYGKGYYDRFFSIHTAVYRIGIAYENQIETALLAEETDIKMHALATERKMYFGITRTM